MTKYFSKWKKKLKDDKFPSEIIWLSNPDNWDYVRMTVLTRGIRRPPTNNSLKRSKSDFYKLIGYSECYESFDEYSFTYYIFWLKNYDRDCPKPLESYQTIGCPNEAVKISDLKKYYSQD